MRVIGGSVRGRNLKGPPRPKHAGPSPMRPTSDMIRGVIFDMLDAMGASYDRVLDLFAGTGALGIEALSRGDGVADFVDTDAAAVGVINANLRATGFEERARVHRFPAQAAVGRLSGAYSLVIADAPYNAEDPFDAARAVAGSPLVDEESVVVVEHHRRVVAPESLGAMKLYRSRRHGDTVVSVYAGSLDR